MNATQEIQFSDTDAGQVWDKILGTILVLCTVVGMPGNLISLGYFWFTKKKDLATLLYIAICCIDLFTSFAHFPVMIVLLDNRWVKHKHLLLLRKVTQVFH